VTGEKHLLALAAPRRWLLLLQLVSQQAAAAACASFCLCLLGQICICSGQCCSLQALLQ
jgi:hypothetical protein